MVISRLLAATMVAGDPAPRKGPNPPPSGGSARADAAANAQRQRRAEGAASERRPLSAQRHPTRRAQAISRAGAAGRGHERCDLSRRETFVQGSCGR